MTQPAFCTLTQVKQYLPLNQDSDGSIDPNLTRDDPLLQEAIPAFSQAINDHLGWKLQTETVTAQVFEKQATTSSRVTIDADGYLIIKTNYPTIQSVSAIAYKTQWTQNWIPVSTSAAMFDTLADTDRPSLTSFAIRVDNTLGWLNYRSISKKLWVQVSYVGGYATIPAPIVRACVEWIGHDYRLRDFIPTMSAGFIGMPNTSIQPKEIPPHIAKLIDPYMRTYQ